MMKHRNKIIPIVIPVILWFVMMAILWVIQFRIYGECIETGFTGWLIITIVVLIALMQEKEEPKQENSKKNSKLKNVLRYILPLLIYAAYWSWLLMNDHSKVRQLFPYCLVLYQFLSLLAVYVIYCIIKERYKKQTGKASSHSVLYCALFATNIVVTILFCIIVQPMTVNQAKELLEKEEFQRVEYQLKFSDKLIVEGYFSDSVIDLKDDDDLLQFYIFTGEKDGNRYEAAVSVLGRKVVAKRIISNQSRYWKW